MGLMEGLPRKETESGWAKVELRPLGKVSPATLALDAGKLGKVLVKWTTKEPATRANLLGKVVRDRKAGPWRVKWFRAEDGTVFLTDVLDEEQYRRRRDAEWRHRQYMQIGWAESNPHMS